MKWVKRAIIVVLLIVASPLLLIGAGVFAFHVAVHSFFEWLFNDVR